MGSITSTPNFMQAFARAITSSSPCKLGVDSGNDDKVFILLIPRLQGGTTFCLGIHPWKEPPRGYGQTLASLRVSGLDIHSARSV